jgi:hypothetical protein
MLYQEKSGNPGLHNGNIIFFSFLLIFLINGKIKIFSFFAYRMQGCQKTGGKCQAIIKYTEWPRNMPNGSKRLQMSKNMPTFSIRN